jgi:hypothetical protein
MSVLHIFMDMVDHYDVRMVHVFHEACARNLRDTIVCGMCGEGLFGLEQQTSRHAVRLKEMTVEDVRNNQKAYVHTNKHIEQFIYCDNGQKAWLCRTCKRDVHVRAQYTPQYRESYCQLLYHVPFDWLQMA